MIPVINHCKLIDKQTQTSESKSEWGNGKTERSGFYNKKAITYNEWRWPVNNTSLGFGPHSVHIMQFTSLAVEVLNIGS